MFMPKSSVLRWVRMLVVLFWDFKYGFSMFSKDYVNFSYVRL